MEDPNNPYRSSAMESIPADANIAPARKAASVQVFGILHLVFGVIGILLALVAILSALVGNAAMGAGGLMDANTLAELDKIKGWSLLDAGIKTVLGILLIVSGILLLKYRFQGLRLSNTYCFLSIAHKVFAIWMFMFITWPIMQNMYDNMPGMDATSASIARKAGMFGGTIGILLALIYPILVLILLNRDHVKASLN